MEMTKQRIRELDFWPKEIFNLKNKEKILSKILVTTTTTFGTI
jgi:hypothetical protein